MNASTLALQIMAMSSFFRCKLENHHKTQPVSLKLFPRLDYVEEFGKYNTEVV